MAQFFNYYEPIQIFMDNVKKEIISKTNNLYNLRNLREILNSLFNLFDYEITLINQIIIFTQSTEQNNKNNNSINLKSNVNYNYNNYNKTNSQKNNLYHLININKDIMVSMIIKFLFKINSILNKSNNKFNDKNKYAYLKNDSQPLFNQGKIINLLYSNNNKNFLLSKSNNSNGNKLDNTKYKPCIRNNYDKVLDTSFSNKYNRTSSTKNNLSNNKNRKKSNKLIQDKENISKSNKNNDKTEEDNKSNNEIKYKGLITDVKVGDKIKKKGLNKSNSVKDIYIDFNNENLKSLFSMPIYYNNTLNTRSSKEE